MDRIIITTFDYKKHNNILAAKALYIAEEIAFRSSLILSASAKKGVFQITVDLKSLQIKITITNLVFIKLLQIVNSNGISKI